MAGIGIALRKLASQDNYLGVIRAYIYSAIIGLGAWLLITATLSILSFFSPGDFEGTLVSFKTIILYNLLFSFVASAPLFMVGSRYVSDCIFQRDCTPVPGILLTSQFYIVIPSLILSTLFFFFVAKMNVGLTLLSIANFIFFTQIWYCTLFLSAIHNFRAIIFSWFMGTTVTTILGLLLSTTYRIEGMLFSLNVGLALLIFLLQAHILAEYPYRFIKPEKWGYYLRKFQCLFWAGFFLFAAMWVDKIIMWLTPNATLQAIHLLTYPVYDEGMLRSYLSIIPVMALFILSVETHFYDTYIRYVKNIEEDSPFAILEADRKELVANILDNGRNIIILQGSLTFFTIILAPAIYEWLNLNFIQLSIFRFGALGAFFNALNLFLAIFFSYFDSQKNMLIIALCMFFGNLVCTSITLFLGFPYYGVGYALSMIIAFFVGSILFARYLQDLHYNIFVKNAQLRKTKGEPLKNEDKRC